jgi:hypothetical protein
VVTPAKAKRHPAGGPLDRDGSSRSGFLSWHVTVSDAAIKVSSRFASAGWTPSESRRPLCKSLQLAGVEGDGAGQDGDAGVHL